MSIVSRVRTIARRAARARSLGFNFSGTSHFQLPNSAILGGERRILSFPYDQALALDIMDIWLDDDYGLTKIDRSVRTVLDIGANVGLFSLWAWQHFPNARIHSYEPNPAIQTHLEFNLRYLPDVRIWAQGVSDQSELAHLKLGKSSRLAQTTTDPGGEIVMIDIKTAIDRLGGQVDLIKLDCEGAEWALFRDVEAFRAVREIRMEYHLTDGRYGTAYLSNRQADSVVAYVL
jgi:FkbM family methyltransferase